MLLDQVAVCNIVVGSDPLRESPVSSLSKRVLMAEDTEYQIMVKNLSSCNQIKVNIKMDGVNITPSSLLVLPSGTLHLERFEDIAKKFKFVPYKGSGQEDSVKQEDAGVVEVVIRYDADLGPTQPYMDNFSHGWTWHRARNPWVTHPWIQDPWVHDTSGQFTHPTTRITCFSAQAEAGVTVEGDDSDQKFAPMSTTQMFWFSQTLRFKIELADRPTSCSMDHDTLSKVNFKYCSECGIKV